MIVNFLAEQSFGGCFCVGVWAAEREGCHYSSVALGHRGPGSREPGDGALELGVATADFCQARVVHGRGRGGGQGGERGVGDRGAPEELRRQATCDGAGRRT